MSYSVSGKRADGEARVYAVHSNRQWILERVLVTIPNNTLRIPVIADGHKPDSRGPVQEPVTAVARIRRAACQSARVQHTALGRVLRLQTRHKRFT